MKFGFELRKKRMIETGFWAIAALALYFWSGYPFPIWIGFTAAVFLLQAVQLKPSKKGLWPWIWTGLLYAAGPPVTTFFIQYIILEPELFAKTSKKVFRLNVVCVTVVFLVLLLVLASVRWAWILAQGFLVLVAFADYFVYEFRQNEINFGDLTTIGTGLSVAGQYDFVMPVRGALSILAVTLMCMFVRKFRILLNNHWIHHIVLRVLALVGIIMCCRYLEAHAMMKATQTWEKKGSYKNGFVLNFVLGVQDSIIKPPEGYSLDVVRELEETYGPSDTGAGDPGSTADANSSTLSGDIVRNADEAFSRGEKPVVITIMSESFADLRLVGDLKTNVDIMPFMDSLEENTLRGFALSSVFGAKTPNSEWEYMTGHSMAFLPVGSVVYQQYLDKRPYSMVAEFKNAGYRTVAMHPYFQAGWRRNTVYPKLGFDEMYFMDTGDFDETKILREYITDEELYDKIILQYEKKKPEEDLFIMSITMQNHGGYKKTYEGFTADVQYTGGHYSDANQYLTVLHESDAALEKLITYFQAAPDPVEIIFFGDHLPSLNGAFFKSLNGKGVSGLTLSQLENLFSVPFFIWTNYDTPEEEIDRTSLNYLGMMAIERAGLELSPYEQFHKDMMEVIPALNLRGYYSKSTGKYLHVEDAVGEEAEWIRKYQILQYNAMFDKRNRSSIFFPYFK